MARAIPKHLWYVSFLHDHIKSHGTPPTEAEIAAAFSASASTVKNKLLMLEDNGLIHRERGVPGSLKLLIPEVQIPPWPPKRVIVRKKKLPAEAAQIPTENRLYALKVYLGDRPVRPRADKNRINRTIEIRGDQTLDDLHEAIFEAFDRYDEHLYEFTFGQRLNDRSAAYGRIFDRSMQEGLRDAARTRIDTLKLAPLQEFFYLFDFGDSWTHRIRVERIESAVPAETYPRISARLGKSPPQYGFDGDDFDDDGEDEGE